MAKPRIAVTRRRFVRDAALVTAGVVAGPSRSLGQPGAPAAPLGAQLMGKLEGPELVLDPAKWPKKFGEAPALAELVKQGKLPPVDQRVPDEPMVVKPVHTIGKYDGTWRRGFTGPGDGENGNRIVSTDKILFWDHTGTKIQPCIAKDWKVSDDGRRVGQSPAAMGVRIVSRKLGNIPARQINAQHRRTPCSSHPATFFYKA